MKKLLLPLFLATMLPALAADPAEEFPKCDVLPRPIKRAPPEYPDGLRAAGVVGNVTIDAIIGKDGSIEEVHVERSNNPFFERPTIDAVMKWRFTPASKNGAPVKTRIRQQITFHLSGMEGASLWSIEKPRDPAKLPEPYRWEIPPEPVSTLMAAYPFEALQAGKQGKVTVRFLIDPEGHVVTARVMKTTHPELGEAIVAMIDGWRFKPARKADGTPSYALITLTRQFLADGRGDVPVSNSAQWILSRLAKNKLECPKPSELDAPLKPISIRPPIYPSALRNAGSDGEAQIEFYVDERGDAQLPRVVSASAPEFGYAAVQAVATWRFAAPKKAGKGTVVRVRQLVQFHLNEPVTPPPAEFVP